MNRMYRPNNLILEMESSTLLLQAANENRPRTLAEEMKDISTACARLRTKTARMQQNALAIGLAHGAFVKRGRGR